MRFKCLLGKHEYVPKKIILEDDTFRTVYQWVWKCMYCGRTKVMR